MRAIAALASPSSRRPLATCLANEWPTRATVASAASRVRDRSITQKPARAATSVSPHPMIPLPTMPMCLSAVCIGRCYPPVGSLCHGLATRRSPGGSAPFAWQPGAAGSVEAVHIALDRLIPLDNVHNSRDLGGYETADGRHTRWRTLFRADSLSHLAGDDLDAVRALGLHTVIDLRLTEESEKWGSFPVAEC